MNTRLQQFLAAENISQAQFAESLGVARASISHILSGRNKPGFDILESMVRHYPNLNFEWLLTGRGKMYTDPGSRPEMAPASPATPPITSTETQDKKNQVIEDKKVISKITIFYSDGTFLEIE